MLIYIKTQFLILLFSCVAFTGFAQTDTPASEPKGTISGQLKQDDGEPAIGAQLFVYTVDGEQIVGSANTQDDNENLGRFTTDKIPIGVYDVHIKYPSYRNVIVTAVPVEKGKATMINLKLHLQDPHYSEDEKIPYATIAPKIPPVTPNTSKQKEKKKIQKD
jgi:hypothetical protein